MSLIRCPECRKPISESAPNCPNCGITLSPEVVRAEKRKKHRVEMAVALIKLGLSACILAGCFWLYNHLPTSVSIDSLMSDCMLLSDELSKPTPTSARHHAQPKPIAPAKDDSKPRLSDAISDNHIDEAQMNQLKNLPVLNGLSDEDKEKLISSAQDLLKSTGEADSNSQSGR
jgi:hypothetical protein